MRKFYIFIIILLTAASCVPTEKLKYTIDENGSKNEYFNDIAEKTIQPYDYLYIRIYSLDETTSSIFNTESQYGQNSEMLQSYVVNDQGLIFFPFIGRIDVKDLTLDQAKIKLEKELNKYLSNVSIMMRFVGNKITVVGEVNQPGNFSFFDEKISIFQALGLAGDIADFGDKTRVTLLREKDDKIYYHYLDLTDKRIVESPFYYLLPNDILIVQPLQAKYRTLQDRSFYSLIFSTISTVTGLFLTYLSINKSN